MAKRKSGKRHESVDRASDNAGNEKIAMADERGGEQVYKQLSTEMREGLRDIYRQLSSASKEQGDARPETRALFQEATSQLNEILAATEKATMTIMEIVEKQLSLQEESSALLTAVNAGSATEEQKERLAAINSQLGEDLTTLLTSLSFQDIAGQRVKKVVAALTKIEESVVELYVSSGLIMDAAAKDPAGDAQKIRDEAKKAMDDFRQNRQVSSELKGPDASGISQDAVDDMLAQLGL